MRGLKNIESAIEFTQGWLAHYNYLRPHNALHDKTPAEVAGIDYPYKNWGAIIRNHVPNNKVVIDHVKRGFHLPDTRVSRTRRVRRRRVSMPRISTMR